MTDRHAGYLVTLDRDIRSDDAEQILAALRMVRGVVSVKALASSWNIQVAEERRDQEWREALFGLGRNGPPTHAQ